MYVSQELKNRVQSKVLEISSKIEKEYGFKMPYIHITYNLTSIKTAAQAVTSRNGGRYEVRINVHYFLENERAFFEDTIPHEVCHIGNNLIHNFPYYAHGYEWQTMMRKVGCNPSRTHNYSYPKALVKSRYLYKCRCCSKDIVISQTSKHNRIQNGTRSYISKCCKAPLVFVR